MKKITEGGNVKENIESQPKISKVVHKFTYSETINTKCRTEKSTDIDFNIDTNPCRHKGAKFLGIMLE